MHNDTATEQTPGAYDPRNHGHSIGLHVVKRVKLQNIAYKTSKIVCGWGFTPNPTGRAYTAPSHHLVRCMGIAIHTPHHSHDRYLMSNVPLINNAKIAYGPETWLRHTCCLQATYTINTVPWFRRLYTTISTRRRMCNVFTGVTAYDYDN